MTAALRLERPRIPIAEQILDCFPSGSYALAGLLRLMDIVESDTVPTAAVECRIQPRLLVNPEFVREHAATSEKLLMLVMHELHHVLLGHTTLFPTVTPVQNFVFDAVINGIISRMFPAAEYTSFLTDYYDADAFPHFLLRPPRGWPNRIENTGAIPGLPIAAARRVREVHTGLYSEAGATYKEVFNLLPKLLPEDAIKSVPLIGGHGEDGATAGDFEHRAPVLFDVVRGIVEEWPQPPNPIKGRSLAEVLLDTTIKPHRTTSSRAVLRRLIRKVAGAHAHGTIRRTRDDTLFVPTPIPSLDRRSAVLRVLGHQPLLYTGEVPWRRTVRTGERVHVYLDVSGSMDAVKDALYGAVLDCREYVHPQVHLFSTKVADITLAELSRGVCKSTGGTDAACFAKHMADNRVGRALVITDGWVGAPRGRHRTTLNDAKLAVALLGENTNENDLKNVTNFTETLPIGA
jgi:hypothetical protein